MKEYCVTHWDRDGDDMKSYIRAESLEEARKRAMEEFDDVSDVRPVRGPCSNVLIAAFIVVIGLLFLSIRFFART